MWNSRELSMKTTPNSLKRNSYSVGSDSHLCYTQKGFQYLAGFEVTPKDHENVYMVVSSHPN